MAIGIGAGWFDLWGKVLTPAIPLPEGDRLVVIETQDSATNQTERRVLHDFLEWRRDVRTIEALGAFRPGTTNLSVANTPAEPIPTVQLTSAAFRAARVPPLLGRGLRESDEMAGAADVVIVGYDVWQRLLGGRQDAIGSIVKLGNTPATVIGVMPQRFAYPFNQQAWMPLGLRASYGALEGGPISVVGRLAPAVTLEQANAEMGVIAKRAATALPETHAHLQSRVMRLGETPERLSAAQFAVRHLPVLLVLIIACTSVGTLVYARTATRQGEIAVRSALGASRGRIIAQLFVEALVLTVVSAAIGLFAADKALTWGIENAARTRGHAPFWMTAGLNPLTGLYAGGLALICAAMLSLLPALRATQRRAQSQLANLGVGGATLRFGRVWTGAMIFQVAVTTIGIPVAMETASEAIRKSTIRAAFPGGDYVAASVDLDYPADEETTPAADGRRTEALAAFKRRIAQEPGVIAVTFADRAPGAGPARGRTASIELPAGPWRYRVSTSTVDADFFAAFDRPLVAGRGFRSDDQSPAALTVVVNEAFVRGFHRQGGNGWPIGVRLQYPDQSAAAAFEIVGVVRDVGLDPDDEGNESPFVFHAASPQTVAPLMMSARVHGDPATLAARLPMIASDVDAGLFVRDAQPLSASIHERDLTLIVPAAALGGVTLLVLFLSALGIFSLMSVSVSRRTREIGLRAALGADPRSLLTGILSRAALLMGSGIAAGSALVLLSVALGQGPSGRPIDDVTLFAGYLPVTAAVMMVACLLACIGPARRAVRINPIDALRQT